MRRYMVWFEQGAMGHLDADGVVRASVDSHQVVRDAKAAGTWIFGGVLYPKPATLVGVDGVAGPAPSAAGTLMAGFSIIETNTREQALEWAARLAKACACTQQVHEIMFDAES